jgi:flocculation protein FLO11
VSLPGTFVVKEVTTSLPGTTSTSTTTTIATTTTTTTLPRCGNGTIDTAPPAEQCDPAGSDVPMMGCTASQLCDPNTCQCVDIVRTLTFALGNPVNACGNIKDSGGIVIRNLTCGGLNIGGGLSSVPEGPTPDGSVSKFSLSCTGSSCDIGPTNVVPEINTATADCTNTGCNFGTPLPIPNPVAKVITTCVLNTWASPASGTVDLSTGTSTTSVPLTSDIYVTGNFDQPCPRCSAAGSPSTPATGTCDRGPRAAMACTTTSSTGLTRDCPTGGTDATHPCTPGGGLCVDGVHVGQISVNLTPLTTDTATATNPGGIFCTGQTTAGCFGAAACRTITENGQPAAGPITPGTPKVATLASVFCIAATGNGLVDATANLPGPGAISLPGTFELTETMLTP